MTDISTSFDEILKQHNAHISHHRRFQSDVLDEFLKEAYRIVRFTIACRLPILLFVLLLSLQLLRR